MKIFTLLMIMVKTSGDSHTILQWIDGPLGLPDGRRIAFYSDRDGAFSIYTMDLAGKNIKRIVDSSDRPAVSPDGSGLL